MEKKFELGNKLTPEQYKLIAAAVLEIHKVQRTKDLKFEADRRTHDARIALKNYRKFRIYSKNAVANVKEAKKVLVDLMAEINSIDDELKVEAIIHTRERTLVMIAHINKMLKIYKKMCETTGEANDMRRWNILYDFYINPTVKPNANEIAEKYYVDRSTVFSDISRACEEMGPLFFGVFGME